MNKMQVGIIGCGYWGPNLIRNFTEISMSEVVAVADLREERLNFIKNAYHGVKPPQITKISSGWTWMQWLLPRRR